jgi:hypothetical protein
VTTWTVHITYLELQKTTTLCRPLRHALTQWTQGNPLSLHVSSHPSHPSREPVPLGQTCQPLPPHTHTNRTAHTPHLTDTPITHPRHTPRCPRRWPTRCATTTATWWRGRCRRMRPTSLRACPPACAHR